MAMIHPKTSGNYSLGLASFTNTDYVPAVLNLQSKMHHDILFANLKFWYRRVAEGKREPYAVHFVSAKSILLVYRMYI